MKAKTAIILFYIAALIIGGCIPSLHPLYTDETLIFDEKLIGKWSDEGDDTIWEFRRSGEKKYNVRLSGNGSGGRFEGHLVNLDGALFLDLYPEKLDIDDGFYEIHFVRAHTFLRVSLLDPNLQLAMMKPDIIEDDPNALRHERTDDNMVLTASTEELQKFMIKHANDANAFDSDAAVMTRRIPLYHDEDIIFDEKLIGTWEGENGQILDSVKNENAYEMLFIDENGDEYEFTAQLVKTKDVELLNIFFDWPTLECDKLYSLHLIPDKFVVIDQIEPKLLLREVEYEELSESLKQNTVNLKQQDTEVDYIFEGIRVEP